jgi:hypothetical protein
MVFLEENPRIQIEMGVNLPRNMPQNQARLVDTS